MSFHNHSQVPVQIRSERTKSFSTADFPSISKSEEQWRYLDPSRLNSLDVSLERFSGEISGRYELVEKGSLKLNVVPEDRISALVSETNTHVVRVQLSEEHSTANIQINTEDKQQSLQILVEVEQNVSADLILNHVGNGDLAEFVEVRVASGASLKFSSIHNHNGSTSALVSAQFFDLGSSSSLEYVSVSLTGKTIRVVPTVTFSGEGASAKLHGAFFATGDQYIENRPFIDHNQPNCVSDVSYKGALLGEKAHTVWVGDVLIRQEAVGTKTYELNRNLLLTDGARADSVPNLEIETGQIEGAGHASASGRFDEEQLFYLQARGVPELQAKQLVVQGFIGDVIQRINDEDLVDSLNALVESKLGVSI